MVKPDVLTQEFIRVSDIVKKYPIGKSTIWDWASKGKLNPIKVSPRVTVFSIAELQELFTYGVKDSEEIKPQRKKRKKRRIKKTELTKVQKKSDREMIDEYLQNNRKTKSQVNKNRCFKNINVPLKKEKVSRSKHSNKLNLSQEKKGVLRAKNLNKLNSAFKKEGILGGRI